MEKENPQWERAPQAQHCAQVRERIAGKAEKGNPAAGKAPDTRSALEDGARACIKFMGKSEYRQIVVEDGPAVVGLQRWYEIDRSIGLGNMELALAVLESEGNLAVAASDGLARALFGALTELGLAYSRSELKLEEATDAFVQLIHQLGVRSG